MDLDLCNCLGRLKLTIAKLQRTDIVICSYSRKRKKPVLQPNNYGISLQRIYHDLMSQFLRMKSSCVLGTPRAVF